MEKDWQPFILPAGYCDTLNARVTQLLDLNWGNSIEYLTEIMSNPVAPKIFAGKSVLCVAPEWVPVASKAVRRVGGSSLDDIRCSDNTFLQNNSDNEKAKESARMVPRIILAMGAARVEAVPELKHASSSDLSAFDLVVVKEQHDASRIPGKATRCVNFQWVKDCLIAARLLSYPDAQ